MSTIVATPVRVKPPPADIGETISPGCASFEITTPLNGARISRSASSCLPRPTCAMATSTSECTAASRALSAATSASELSSTLCDTSLRSTSERLRSSVRRASASRTSISRRLRRAASALRVDTLSWASTVERSSRASTWPASTSAPSSNSTSATWPVTFELTVANRRATTYPDALRTAPLADVGDSTVTVCTGTALLNERQASTAATTPTAASTYQSLRREPPRCRYFPASGSRSRRRLSSAALSSAMRTR